MPNEIIYCLIVVAGFIWLLVWIISPKKSTSSQQPTQGAAPGTTPAPTPAATASAASKYSWLTPLLVVIALIAIGWWLMPKQGTKSLIAPPSAKSVFSPINAPFHFIGGEKIEKKEDWIRIKKGGYAQFVFDLTEAVDGNYKIYYQGKRSVGGFDYLELNGGKSNPKKFFHTLHQITGIPVEMIFFDEGGTLGERKYFRPGKNYIRIWADEELWVLVEGTKVPRLEVR